MSAISRNLKSFENTFNQSPGEFHARYAFPADAKCDGCQAKPSIRALVMIPIDEAEKRGMVPMGAAAAPFEFPELAPVLVPIRETAASLGPKYYVRISKAYSCACCRKDLERALAKTPSWAIVEINEGPNPRNLVMKGYEG